MCKCLSSFTELIPSLRPFKLPLLLVGVATYLCLAYVLLAVLHDYCIVCSLLYFNHALLVINHIFHCYCKKPHKPVTGKKQS